MSAIHAWSHGNHSPTILAGVDRYQQRILTLPAGKKLPPSIPLLVHGSYECDSETCTLKRKEREASQQFYLLDDALELIRGIDKPVAVLSICGPYRTGKSYFLSRVVSEVVGNSTEIFQLGHTMDPFTQGIWMATTALECDEFVLLLLDTQGTDTAFFSAVPTNILIMSILLSSYLIYNSMGVPRISDLHNMSCFAHLSSCILAEKGNEEDNIMNLQKHFPDFLWLLRDASLKAKDGQGRRITPTEYLKTRILIRSKEMRPTACDHVVRAVLELFPSLECKTIAPPLVEDDILENIMENEDQLSPRFNEETREAVRHILQSIKPKRGFMGNSIEGPVLASLVEQYKDVINTPNSVPNLEGSWLAVVELNLLKHVTKLFNEYEQEMVETTRNELPVENGDKELVLPQTLMGIHNSLVKPKQKVLQDEINRLLPLQPDNAAPTTELRKSVLASFQQRIASVLSRFKGKNFDSSQAQCEELFAQLYHPIQEKISTPGYSIGEFHCDVKRLKHKYFSQSLGPARHTVWWEKQCKVIGTVQETDFIPGPPLNLRVSGRAHDRIKIHWYHSDINATAALCFKVEMKRKNANQWTEIARLPPTKLSTVAKNLESNTKYCFRVCTENRRRTNGVYTAELKTETKFSKAAQGVLTSLATVGGATVGAPFVAPVISAELIKEGRKTGNPTMTRVGAACLGISIVTAPAAPLAFYLTGALAHMRTQDALMSDVDIEESDDDCESEVPRLSTRPHI